MTWRPAISQTKYTRQPPVGELIGHGHKAWRVTRVEPLIPGDWSERAREQWVKSASPDPWGLAPFRVVVTPATGGKEHLMLVEPWHYLTWDILPEDYAVCVRCGEMAPCREYEEAQQAVREMKSADQEMSLPDGCCPTCREPITTRQKTHRFPGENLLNPLGRGDVQFHTRSKCHYGAQRYEEMWVAAWPDRPRSLLTLKCEGNVVTHADGSAECVGRISGADCPNIYAEHRGYSSCYLASHGCPRLECAGSRHGCKPARGLRTDGTPGSTA